MTILNAITVAVDDLDRAIAVYEAIIGVESVDSTLAAGPVSVVLREAAADGRGVSAIELGSDEPGQPVRASGIEVRFGPTAPPGTAGGAGAPVDHLALRVADLMSASRQWEAITGCRAEQMGIHPVSDGAFSAARLHLGQQMIELVAPTPGVASPMAARLASHGEGPAALAIPVPDIDRTRTALSRLGAEVFRHDPHWMVHPRDAGGVLVQLTPRVGH